MNPKTRKWLGVAVCVTGLVICGIGLWLLLIPAMYQAITRIKVVHHSNPVVFSDPYYIGTECEVIGSKFLLGKVVNALNQNEDGGDRYADGKGIKAIESFESLRRRLTCTILDNTSIEIAVIDKDPTKASKIANLSAESYHAFMNGGTITYSNGLKSFVVEIVSPAVPPNSPMGYNRFIGSILVFCGLVSLVYGYRIAIIFTPKWKANQNEIM